MNATIQTIPELLIQTRGNQTEVARMLSCARGTVLKYNRDSKGERHVIVNGVPDGQTGQEGKTMRLESVAKFHSPKKPDDERLTTGHSLLVFVTESFYYFIATFNLL